MRGRTTIFVAACFAGGCGFDVQLGGTSDGGRGADGEGSATGDGGLGCYGTGLVEVCPLTPPVPDYTISVPTTIDTNVSGNCTTVSGTNVTGTCVLIAENVTVGAPVRGIGPRPLVIVATKTLTIASTIDVASHDDSRGAGASTTVCANGPGPNGLGGGAGGSFGGQGGLGGNDNGGTPGPTSTPPTAVRGGCGGQDGGGPFGIGGDGGDGGGALYLIAGMSITVSGTINASGEGGRGATLSVVAGGGGGGGGGSGGMVGLDAPTILVMGQVFANGGGGGGGSSGIENAGSGHEAQSAIAMPEGGTNAAGAGKGGRGAAGPVIVGGAGEARSVITTGGGGGGGGAGHIEIHGTLTLGGQIAPPPVL
ncbi:MAG: hypothetical protein ACKV2T_28660 [Kofleriaceae bacterium]